MGVQIQTSKNWVWISNGQMRIRLPRDATRISKPLGILRIKAFDIVITANPMNSDVNVFTGVTK